MVASKKDLDFFKNRRKRAFLGRYKKPKVILVDIDGTVTKPRLRMYSMAEEKIGKKKADELEKKRQVLRKKMTKKEISFEKYLLELSNTDIEIGEYLKDYKNYFFGLAKKDLINIPLVRALGALKSRHKAKIIFLTSNLKDYGNIVSENVLKLVGGKGKFDGAVGAEYKYDKKGKAVAVKTLISHDDSVCEGVKFKTKISAIKDYFKENKIKVDSSEVAVVSDADTELMKYYGLGGLVFYPLGELSSQFREIGYIMNARDGLYDFKVDYSKGKDLEIAQKKWELLLSEPNMIKYMDSELRKIIKDETK